MKLDDLGRLLREADPAAVMVDQPTLDRLVRRATGGPWFAWRVPHNHGWVVDRGELFRHADQVDLLAPPEHRLPDTVLVLARPTADDLAGSRAALLGRYWRRLFHLAVHRQLAAAVAAAGPAGLRDRIAAVGPAAFDEARAVLTQDGLLAADADDAAAYVEFAATYLELRQFAPGLVPVHFPGLPAAAAVDRLLAADADADRLFLATRLAGAADPDPKTDDQTDESHDYYYRLTRSAKRRAAAGDVVGAAILHTRAARVAPGALTEPARAAARDDVHALVDRLAAVLSLSGAQAGAWRAVLPALLDKADQGARPVEAELLYDLQRACQEYEQKPFAVDLVDWALQAGRKRAVREVDGRRYVRLPAHLRAATRRLTAARLADADRQALAGLLRAALAGSEDMLRARFRPFLTDALRDAGLRPHGGPEQAALGKTVEELLDRISAAGFFRFADLRDAIARGQIKLPDLAGPQDYLYGDPLLRLDTRLATLLDGVYRPGEVYTRALERGTAFAFGTPAGRWLTVNLLLPFGGGFLAGQFAWLLEFERRVQAGAAVEVAAAVASAAAAAVADPPAVSFFGGWNAAWWFHLGWLLVGGLALALIRSARLRAAAGRAAEAGSRAVRRVAWDLPRRVWADPAVRAVLTSGPVQLAVGYLVKPAAAAGLGWALVPGLWAAGPAARVATFLAAGAAVNSRVGAAAEALLVAVAADLGRAARAVPAVVRWVSDVFRELVGAVEWGLARVDDWVRLNDRVNPVSVAVRGLAGLAWYPVGFLIRFYTVVLIEPGLNPLKLPLSILFAKFVYPVLAVLGLFTIQPLGSPLVAGLVGADAPRPLWAVAWLLVIGTFYLLPDAVTYLFWEMRENWKLYRANRPAAIGPVAVGPHGETVAQLLRPGFHSGTVPKLFARLRAAERAAAEGGDWRAARAHRQALRGVAEAVERFVARDLAAVLNPSPAWGGRGLEVGPVQVGTNRIAVDLRVAGDPRPAAVEWVDRGGWLTAGWAAAGWVGDLPPAPARALGNALAYLYKRAGVDVVWEHVRAELPPTAARADLTPAGLRVWYGRPDAAPVLYDLGGHAHDLWPRSADTRRPADGPPLRADRLMFARVTLTWPAWLAAWQPDGGPVPPRFGPDGFDLVLLPPAREDRTPQVRPAADPAA